MSVRDAGEYAVPPQENTELKITGDTRLNKVLEGVPGALEHIVSLNPDDFGRLKNPVMRKYMSPRISMRRVAAMAHVSEGELLAQLAALSNRRSAAVPRDMPDTREMQPFSGQVPQSPQIPPPWLTPADRGALHWVDLRPIDDASGDPMLPVTVAVRQMQPGETIGIRHRWEPQPLYDIWQKMGLQWFAQRSSADEWHIFVHKPASARPAVPLAGSRSILVELRHLSTQEIPARVLVAFEQLKTGESLELWVEPGGVEWALSSLKARHESQFECEHQASAPDRETVRVTSLAGSSPQGIAFRREGGKE